MTTVINNPGNNEGGSGFGIVIVIVLILVGGFLVYKYGWQKETPAPSANINVTLPTGGETQ